MSRMANRAYPWGVAIVIVASAVGGWWAFGRAKTPVLLRSPEATEDSPAEPTVKLPPIGRFEDIADESGIRFRMGFLPTEQGLSFKINLYDHGCGLAVGDYDGDGWDDLYFLNQLGTNALYRNRGDGTFKDVTDQAGVALGDRVCVGAVFNDFDHDGDQDLYVTSTRGGNVLFRNEGDGRFTDVTESAQLQHVGHSQTAAFFDYDRDGLLDLYLVQTSQWTTNERDESGSYFIGKGAQGRFDDVIAAPPEFNILYQNLGDGRFADVTEESGLKGRGWAGDVSIFDYDEDGWLDVLVTSMFGRAQLYRNDRLGRFVDVTLDVLGRTPFGGVGAKSFDFNNDGRLDVYIVDMHSDMWMGLDPNHKSLQLANQSERVRYPNVYGPLVKDSPELIEKESQLESLLNFRRQDVVFGNAFYEAIGQGRFREVSQQANLETFWPWSIATGDFDNDAYEDVFVATGMGYPFYYWGNYLLMNDGRGAFIDRALDARVEPPSKGSFLNERLGDVPNARSSRGVATFDLEHDGKLEIVTNNFNDGPYLLHNRLVGKNYIAFRLHGRRGNRDAVGALVRIVGRGQVLTRQVHAAGGYLSQSSKVVHFGLGDRDAVEQVEILWPSGLRQVLEGLEANRTHDLIEPLSGEEIVVGG